MELLTPNTLQDAARYPEQPELRQTCMRIRSHMLSSDARTADVRSEGPSAGPDPRTCAGRTLCAVDDDASAWP